MSTFFKTPCIDLHTKFHQNRIVNEDFNILGKKKNYLGVLVKTLFELSLEFGIRHIVGTSYCTMKKPTAEKASTLE